MQDCCRVAGEMAFKQPKSDRGRNVPPLPRRYLKDELGWQENCMVLGVTRRRFVDVELVAVNAQLGVRRRRKT